METTQTTSEARLSLTCQDVSLVLWVSVGFTAVGGLVGGALSDRYGRKPLLIAAILV